MKQLICVYNSSRDIQNITQNHTPLLNTNKQWFNCVIRSKSKLWLKKSASPIGIHCISNGVIDKTYENLMAFDLLYVSALPTHMLESYLHVMTFSNISILRHLLLKVDHLAISGAAVWEMLISSNAFNSLIDTICHTVRQCCILTLKHRETHGCVVSTVATDVLVLKHQAISILSTD